MVLLFQQARLTRQQALGAAEQMAHRLVGLGHFLLDQRRDHQLDVYKRQAQGRVEQDVAEQCLAIRRSSLNNSQHPLEFLAAQQVDDLTRPGKKLDLETLTVWLANFAGQPYLRIDPLKRCV